MLCLDARYPGVAVPPQHAHNPSLQLIINLNFPYPIEVGDEGIRANLAFGGRRFACYVPMEALWAAFHPQDMQGMMWPESMPPEVRDELVMQQAQTSPDTPVAPSSVPPATPRVIAGRQKTSSPKQETDEPAPRQRGHLRVVK
jgi:stringent starvation protein B